MDKCFETVDIANPINWVIWQTHTSPSWSAITIRNRFSSASAFVIFRKSFILLAQLANERNMQHLAAPVKPKTHGNYAPTFRAHSRVLGGAPVSKPAWSARM